MNEIPEVLFVCVHNAGRSQMAAALLDHRAQGRVQVRSGGSAPGERINPAVSAAMAEIGLDISREFPKPVTDAAIRSADVVVTMGCGDACPIYPGKRYEDWALDDPMGQDIERVRPIRDEIDRRVQALLVELTAPAAGVPEGGLMGDAQGVRDAVQRRYAELAVIAAEGGVACCGDEGQACFGPGGYGQDELGQIPELAANASLGCGNPTAVAELSEGDIVLDLGSGGGIDVILSARRVAPTGKAYGLDMTDEMLDLARRNAAEAGVANVEFLKGHIEEIPLPDNSVDVVISNCVINLSTDKPRVLREVARVLRPGGRLAVTDVVADPDLDDQTRRDLAQWTGCIAGAMTKDLYRSLLENAGLSDITLQETHRVHPHAGSAIIRASMAAGTAP